MIESQNRVLHEFYSLVIFWLLQNFSPQLSFFHLVKANTRDLEKKKRHPGCSSYFIVWVSFHSSWSLEIYLSEEKIVFTTVWNKLLKHPFIASSKYCKPYTLAFSSNSCIWSRSFNPKVPFGNYDLYTLLLW